MSESSVEGLDNAVLVTLTVSLRMAISLDKWSFSTCRASMWAFT